MKTDKDGMIEGHPLHDSELVSLVYHRDDLRLSFERGSSTTHIDLVHVKKSLFKDFKLNAVLSEIFVWKVAAVPENIIQVSDGAWRTLFADAASENMLLAEVAFALDKLKDDLLVQFNFSYGGSAALICGKMIVNEQSPPPNP